MKKSSVTHSAQYERLINCPKWRKLRNWYIAHHPLCEECISKGRTTLAVLVHHRIPIETTKDEKEMARRAYDERNLEALCHDCHVEAHIMLKSHQKGMVRRRTDKDVEHFKGRFL